MNVRSPTLPTRRRDRARPEEALVVVDGWGVPGWAVDWCRRSGRTLQMHLPSARTPGDLTAVDHRVRAVADLAGSTVLVVPGPPAARTPPPRIIAAVRDLPADGLVLADAAEIAVGMDVGLVVAHGVPISFGERSVGLDVALDHGRWLLDAAAEQVSTAAPGLGVEPRLSASTRTNWSVRPGFRSSWASSAPEHAG